MNRSPIHLFVISSVILMLSTVLSGCSQVLMPAQTSVQEPVFPAETIITSLAAPTETSLLDSSKTPSPIPSETLAPTLTPVPTEIPPTATPTIDFPIPDAPSNVDPDLWHEAYVDGMQNNGYIRLKTSSGLAQAYWDSGLNTLIWDLGSEKYAYNQEFDFTGDLVYDVYGRKWIVRKVIISEIHEGHSIWRYDTLHVPDSNVVILGEECGRHIKEADIEFCGMIGQVIGKETLSLEGYLVPNFPKLSEDQAGIFFGGKNLVFEFLKIRLPTSMDPIEFLLPICVAGKCDITTIGNISGEKILQSTPLGSMIYVSFTSVNDITFASDINQRRNEGPALSANSAFGFGEHLSSLLKRYFNIYLTGTPLTYPDIAAPIFDTEKLVIDHILPFPANIKTR